VTHYDIEDDLVYLNDNQLFEICYPHGACQFTLPQDVFEGFGTGVIFSGDVPIGGNVGIYHLRNPKNILTSFEPAYKRNYFPQVCRYQPNKRPSLITYFLIDQKERSKELLLNAKIVTIVGVQCLIQNDKHIWEPLAQTQAFIVYVEPGPGGQDRFRNWAANCGKVEGKDFKIIPETFEGAFGQILQFNNL
ncbi:MAG: hypothetical protein ACR2IA_13230, partial [Pyrinomonadaceae bacterium]